MCYGLRDTVVLSRDSWLGQRMLGADFVQIGDGGVDCGFEIVEVGEGAMGEMMSLEIAPRTFDVLSSGAYLGSHSTVSQCRRASRAARLTLLVWIGPLSSTSTTGLVG